MIPVNQNADFDRFPKPTRQDQFLAKMGRVVPLDDLSSVIEPCCLKVCNDRPHVRRNRMLRMYSVQHWFNVSDESCEDALLDGMALLRFEGIDLGVERVPDATTLLKLRRLIEENNLGAALFAKLGEVLRAEGLKVGNGTIRHITIIPATSSTKSATGERDPSMHQTLKGEQWLFGMKLYIGVERKTGLAYSALVPAKTAPCKRPKGRETGCLRLLCEHRRSVWHRKPNCDGRIRGQSWYFSSLSEGGPGRVTEASGRVARAWQRPAQ